MKENKLGKLGQMIDNSMKKTVTGQRSPSVKTVQSNEE
jgi:hypothetical protein